MTHQEIIEVVATAIYDHHCGNHKTSEFAIVHPALQRWIRSQAEVAIEAYKKAKLKQEPTNA